MTAPSPRRTRFWIVQLVLAAAGALLLAGLVRSQGLAAIGERLAQVRPCWLLAYAAIVVAVLLAYAARWRLLLRTLGEEVPLGRLLGSRLAGLAVGALTPGAKLGGEPLRMAMLSGDGVRPGSAVASVVVDRSLELLANVVFGVAYCGLFALRDGGTAGRLLLIIAGSGAALAVGILLLLRRLGRGGSLVPEAFVPLLERLGGSRSAVAETDEALRHLVLRERRAVGWAIVAALLTNALIFAEYTALLWAFAVSPTVPELAGAMLGVGLAHALPIPASLGALEGTQAAMMHVAGGSAELGLAAATVARLRDVVWTLPGLLYLAVAGLRRRR